MDGVWCRLYTMLQSSADFFSSFQTSNYSVRGERVRLLFSKPGVPRLFHKISAQDFLVTVINVTGPK